jgi:hypothetical protein
VAPAQARSQVFTQPEIGRRQGPGRQDAALQRLRVDEPVERRVLLHGREQVHVVEQDHCPGLVEVRRFGDGGIQPAAGSALLPQRFATALSKCVLPLPAVAPKVGGHGERVGLPAHSCRCLSAASLGPAKKPASVGARAMPMSSAICFMKVGAVI